MFLVYKTDANGPCPPHDDMQGLTLFLVPTGVTEFCSNNTDLLMEFFLNKEPRFQH